MKATHILCFIVSFFIVLVILSSLRLGSYIFNEFLNLFSGLRRRYKTDCSVFKRRIFEGDFAFFTPKFSICFNVYDNCWFSCFGCQSKPAKLY